MLHELFKNNSISDRKLRLYACSVARLLEESVQDKDYGFQILQNELKADGLVYKKSCKNYWWVDPNFKNCFKQAEKATESRPFGMGHNEFANLLRHMFGNPHRPVWGGMSCESCCGKGSFIKVEEIRNDVHSQILEIRSIANDDEIKKAYSKLCIKYHPDRNIGDDIAARKFREVQEAYDFMIENKTVKPTTKTNIIPCKDCCGKGWKSKNKPILSPFVMDLAYLTYSGVNVNLKLNENLLMCNQPELANHFSDMLGRHPKGCWAIDSILEK